MIGIKLIKLYKILIFFQFIYTKVNHMKLTQNFKTLIIKIIIIAIKLKNAIIFFI